MARMPGTVWSPLANNWADQPKMRAFDIICIHTMVGGLMGTDSHFRYANGTGYVGTESHFGTGHDGRIIQWQDTAYQAEANYLGNYHVISIENADTGTGFPAWGGSDVPAFTLAQIEANAQIIAWACRTHNIPCELIPDAKPGRRGIGYHRQGVLGYMAAGAELWSSSRGKVCPGDRRVAQIPAIIVRAKQILNGEQDMPLNDTDLTNISKAMVNALTTPGLGELAWTGTTNGPTSVTGQLRFNAEGLAAVYARQAALESAVSQIAVGAGLDPAIIKEAVADALNDLRIVRDVDGA
jgi:hypothetical protein